jgi:hypothetical protein
VGSYPLHISQLRELLDQALGPVASDSAQAEVAP